MKSIVFATNNAHKIAEIQDILSDDIKIIPLSEIGCTEDIPETSLTIEGNASQKAHYVNDKYKVDCFADDTGLEVDALGGKPGVNSARYAGPGHDFEANVTKLLKDLNGQLSRRARFRTVISLVTDDNETLFDGVINGIIINERRGSKGFGYDPVFIPDGYQQTFAEMSPELKNTISHRAIATRKLIKYLKENYDE
ncbi:MAG: non-canonical purine NTP diphosphatase [Bacteroidales bacterium]|nr:non-canonical purine NTP diphosphatase [Bacteroidales bacterium]MBK9358363.1 non-canonical purine NTP diphosphatase [Bacteroidales bacterium]